MKNKKRLVSFILAGILCVTIAFAALAEGTLLTIWNAGSKLLFDTSNVSLTGHAAFTYDGEVFKVFDGRYLQDGMKSYMQVMLDTPMEDGSTYTGGYTVIADDNRAYSIETSRPKLYSAHPVVAKPSILTNTVMRDSLMRFAGLLLDLMEDRMQGAITQEATDAGTQYRIALKKGEAPEIADAALTLLMHLVGQEYFYVNPDQEIYSAGLTDTAFIDDWDALFAAEYEKAFQEPLPEDFYSLLWDKNGKETPMYARYEMISRLMDIIVTDAEAAYDSGVAVVQPDGSIQHYETYDDYMIANGLEEIQYADYRRAFLAYYEKTVGAPLTEKDVEAIYASTNGELIDRYITMASAMEEDYMQQLRAGGYSCARIDRNGVLEGYNDLHKMDYLYMLDGLTVTRRILHTVTDVVVDTVDMEILLDKEGRITSVTGGAAFTLTDEFDKAHDLAIDFTGLAFDYGTSHVDAFDPEAYGVISAEEFYQGYSINDVDDIVEEALPELPATVVFDGVEYEVYPEGQNG